MLFFAFEKNAVGKISSELKIFFAVGKPLSLMQRLCWTKLVRAGQFRPIFNGLKRFFIPNRNRFVLSHNVSAQHFENEIILPE